MNTKSVLLGIGLAVGVTFCAVAGFNNGYTGSPAPQVLSTTITGGATTAIVITNNVTVQSFSVMTSATGSGSTALISLYDCSSNAAPWFGSNYTSAAYATRTGYATNYVSSYVGYNGYTNWYTNAGWWTLTVTNAAATNALPARATMQAVAGTVATYPYPISFQQGVGIYANSNVIITLFYTPNR